MRLIVYARHLFIILSLVGLVVYWPNHKMCILALRGHLFRQIASLLVPLSRFSPLCQAVTCCLSVDPFTE